MRNTKPKDLSILPYRCRGCSHAVVCYRIKEGKTDGCTLNDTMKMTPQAHGKTVGSSMSWKEGSIEVYGDIFLYYIKQFDKESRFGINGGRISKLMLKRNGEVVCNYDRGWDVHPVDECTKLALDLLLHSENY